MSFVLPHLPTGWHVDQAILSEEERVVVLRFGKDSDPDCMRQDEVLYRIADKVKNFAVVSLSLLHVKHRAVACYDSTYGVASLITVFRLKIYLCDNEQVPDFNVMYELYDPMTIMFFFRNKLIMVDLGSGNNNKLNFVLEDKQELIDIVETVYRGAKKGRGLVVSPKDYSTRYRY
ncbi:mitosis protein DIM1-domain-containing protein [Xylaria castorea]|nr:mitosis protein DIM1-domain-containing protein [Xylaria castorea]